MSFFKKILNYTGFGKKDTMAESGNFEPKNIFKARYQNPKVLITYVKSLPDKFTDDKITVKVSCLLDFKHPKHVDLLRRSDFERWQPWADVAAKA